MTKNRISDFEERDGVGQGKVFTKDPQETFLTDGCIYYLDYDDGFMGVYVKMYQFEHCQYMYFVVCQLFFNDIGSTRRPELNSLQ